MKSENLNETEIEIVQTKPSNLFRIKDFSALFFGGFIGEIGAYFTTIALIFLALTFTSDLTPGESSQAVALITTFYLIPMLFLGPIAGVLVDKFDRKKILIFADIVGASAAFALIFSSTMIHLYIFAVISASVRQFFYPSKSASIPRIVEKKNILKANSYLQTTTQLSRIIGPLLAGFMIALFGLRLAFFVNGVAFIISAIFISTITTKLNPVKAVDKVSIGEVYKGLAEGLKLTLSDRIICFLLIVFGLTMFGVGMIDPLIVPYLSYEFGVGEKEFGFLMSISAISGVVMAVMFSIKGQIKNKVTFTNLSVILLGISILFVGLAFILPGRLVWVFIGMSLIGAVNVGFNIPFSSLLQTIVKNEHLGKISGIINTTLTAMSLVASVIAAIFVKYVTIGYLFSGISLFIILVGLLGLVRIKRLKLEEEAQRREEEAKQQDVATTRNVQEEQDEIILDHPIVVEAITEKELPVTMGNPTID